MRVLLAAPALASALAILTGCGSQETQAPKGSAIGEVLPGSASDAMLPYDTATSAPPLAPDQGWSDGERPSPAAVVPGAGRSDADVPEPEAS
jgi:hypothetical protein